MNKKTTIFLLFLAAIGSLGVRLLKDYNFHNSALLYVAAPFLIAVILAVFTSRQEPKKNWWTGYWNVARGSLIVMLGSSVLLFEGFLCVVMFMPIYFGVMTVGFIYDLIWRKVQGKSKGSVAVHILPVLVLLSAFEGTHEDLSFERHNTVSYETVVSFNIETIKERMSRPINLQKERHWFLKMFPMPYEVDAGNLEEGAVHKIYYRYKKWFFTNIHEGYTELKIAEVGEEYIRTEILHDSSYMSNYIKFIGTHVELEQLSDIQTRVRLNIKFDRKLDPSWYFEPLERYGVKKMAEFLITEIIINDYEQ